MDIKKLKYFITVVQTGSYSEAAEKLFMSQASLSKHIMSLEKELNLNLFDRSRRKISITEEGRFLLDHAIKLTEGYEQMVAELHNLRDKNLSIASMPIMAQYGITKLLSGFSNKHPSIHLSVIESGNDNIYFGLENHNYELAFIRRDNLDITKMDVIDIFKDELVLIMSNQHALSKKSSVSLHEFKDDEFLFLSRETTLYDYSYNACIRAGFEPNIVFTGTRGENIAELVSANMGVALLMKQVACCLKSSNIVMVNLAEMPSSYISLVRLKRSYFPSAAKLFWQYVKEQIN